MAPFKSAQAKRIRKYGVIGIAVFRPRKIYIVVMLN